ncbi:MAG: C_GCAxxG_C_C family protein [Candidatus Caldatribacterium sp.]|nr:C_GCAxxG_C_C family protein [Candidatus Caldatribacterium sp.]
MAKSIDYHRQGFNCAESVLLGLCEDLGVKNPLIPRIATGFGGGIGHTGNICGAVTGAVMAFGIRFGRENPEDKDTRDRLYLLVESFLQEVEQSLGRLDCFGLIGVRLNTEEGLRRYREENLREKCRQIVGTVEDIAKRYLTGGSPK